MTNPYFDSQLFHDITTVTFQLHDTSFIDWHAYCGVKIGICHLHYHPNNPFLFCSFLQQSLFSFWIFQFFITLVIFIVYIKYCNNYSKVLCAVLVAESYLCELLMQMIMRREPKVVLESCRQKMVMAHLRAGLFERDLVYRFSVSQSTASWIWITWVNFISHSKPYQCGPW